jgi:hypothetical protein
MTYVTSMSGKEQRPEMTKFKDRGLSSMHCGTAQGVT